MKKILTVCLTTMLVFSLAACGSSDDAADQEDETVQTSAEAEEDKEEEEAPAVSDEDVEDTRNWSDSEIASYLAIPDSENIEVQEDEEDYFRFQVTGATKEDYETYVGGCQYIGFTQDVKKTADSFEASSDDGYKISISYDADDESYSGSIEPV